MENYNESEIKNAKENIISTILNWGERDFEHLAKVQIWANRTLQIEFEDVLSSVSELDITDVNDILYAYYEAIEQSARENVLWYLEEISKYKRPTFVAILKEIIGVEKLRISTVKFLLFVETYFEDTDIEVYSNYIDFSINSPVKESVLSDTKIELVNNYIKFLWNEFNK